ncbi:hypothetical protein [Sphingomonas sp. 1P08PE]|uniref:hypothetical protein n=1 Tax=Sphingomonas sp. 1P08PE TaxID=554122 RepID=UPI0039A3DA41
MKTIFAATLVAAAALSLGACSKPASEENTVAPAEATFNEADIPAEGNAGSVDDFTNSTAGLDNLAGDNAAATPGNAEAPAGNGL